MFSIFVLFFSCFHKVGSFFTFISLSRLFFSVNCKLFICPRPSCCLVPFLQSWRLSCRAQQCSYVITALWSLSITFFCPDATLCVWTLQGPVNPSPWHLSGIPRTNFFSLEWEQWNKSSHMAVYLTCWIYFLCECVRAVCAWEISWTLGQSDVLLNRKLYWDWGQTVLK